MLKMYLYRMHIFAEKSINKALENIEKNKNL
jgi:hypothetical protein